MLNLTQQERCLILFFTGVALAGLGINFAVKINSQAVRFIRVNDEITKININQASLEELMASGVITPKLAKDIIGYRSTNGAFRDIQELKEIKGIGDYRYEKLKDIFYIE